MRDITFWPRAYLCDQVMYVQLGWDMCHSRVPKFPDWRLKCSTSVWSLGVWSLAVWFCYRPPVVCSIARDVIRCLLQDAVAFVPHRDTSAPFDSSSEPPPHYSQVAPVPPSQRSPPQPMTSQPTYQHPRPTVVGKHSVLYCQSRL